MRMLAQTFLLMVMLLSVSGCATGIAVGARMDGDKMETLYPATKSDIAFMEASATGDNELFHKPSYFISFLFLLDLPVSLITDTLFLPIDIYQRNQWYKNQEECEQQVKLKHRPETHQFEEAKDVAMLPKQKILVYKVPLLCLSCETEFYGFTYATDEGYGYAAILYECKNCQAVFSHSIKDVQSLGSLDKKIIGQVCPVCRTELEECLEQRNVIGSCPECAEKNYRRTCGPSEEVYIEAYQLY